MTHGPLPCPRCGASTDSLKAYRLPIFLLFLGIAWSLRHGTVVACPRCMRRELGRLTVVNLLPANILWVVLLLPWYGIAALRTFTRGHSKAATGVLAAGGYRDPARPPGAPQRPNGKPWHTDPNLARYVDPACPDDFEATFLFTHRGGQLERLPVRITQDEGDVYRATVLQGSQVEPGVHDGLEVFVRPSATHPPLVWLPPTARENLRRWDARCGPCGFDLAFSPAFDIARTNAPHLQPGQEPLQLATQCPACGGPMTLTRRVPVSEGSKAATTGHRWRTATVVAVILSAILVGVAGADSESAGVAASYFAAVLIGVPLGAWISSGWAARERKPWFVPPVVGVGVAALLLGAALVFFETIFPAL